MIRDGREQCRPSALSLVSTCHSRRSAPRLDLHGSEMLRKSSSITRTRVSSVAIYPRTMSEATHIMRSTRTAAEKCLATHPTPYEVCGACRRGAHFAGHTGGQRRAPELIPSHGGQRVHSTRRPWAAWVTSVRSRATVKAQTWLPVKELLYDGVPPWEVRTSWCVLGVSCFVGDANPLPHTP
jgi:hypothetical protein